MKWHPRCAALAATLAQTHQSTPFLHSYLLVKAAIMPQLCHTLLLLATVLLALAGPCSKGGRRSLAQDALCGGLGNPCCCQAIAGGAVWDMVAVQQHSAHVGVGCAGHKLPAQLAASRGQLLPPRPFHPRRPPALHGLLRRPLPLVPLLRLCSPRHPGRLPCAIAVPCRSPGGQPVCSSCWLTSSWRAGCALPGDKLGSGLDEQGTILPHAHLPPQGCGAEGGHCCPPPSDGAGVHEIRSL